MNDSDDNDDDDEVYDDVARYLRLLQNTGIHLKKNLLKLLQKQRLQDLLVEPHLQIQRKEHPGLMVKLPVAPSSTEASADPSTGRVTEEEIRAVLVQSAPLTTQELVEKFKERLKSKEDKDVFAAILKRTVKTQKLDRASYVVLKDK